MARRIVSSFKAKATLLALLALQAGVAEATGGERHVQPVSSETIKISVSVAARYQLRSIDGVPRSGIRADFRPGQFCIDSNAAAGSLPVLLLRAGAESVRPGDEPGGTAIGSIPPCGSGSSRPEIGALPPDRVPGVQIMMVQPE